MHRQQPVNRVRLLKQREGRCGACGTILDEGALEERVIITSTAMIQSPQPPAGMRCELPLGARNAAHITREFKQVFSDARPHKPPNYRIQLKFMIDGEPSKPAVR